MWWCEEGGWPVWATILACLFASVALATFVVVVVVLGLQRRQARRHDAAVQLHIRNDLLGPNDAGGHRRLTDGTAAAAAGSSQPLPSRPSP